MKKTFNINLGGIVFHIDEDAYELLDKYLSNLRIHFSKEEGGEEIVHDMELRISELFSERLNERNQVITLNDVEEIIAQMGKPEEFSEETTQDTSSYSESKEKGVRICNSFIKKNRPDGCRDGFGEIRCPALPSAQRSSPDTPRRSE